MEVYVQFFLKQITTAKQKEKGDVIKANGKDFESSFKAGA
jgi:hypothetical protein